MNDVKKGLVKPEIAPEVIEALRTLRGDDRYHGMTRTFRDAFDVLDNAGVFAAIDEATGYDIDAECACPVLEYPYGKHLADCSRLRVSKCTCPLGSNEYGHLYGCPGDPAEWGDMAFKEAGNA